MKKTQPLTDISSGVNPLGPSRKVKAAIRKALKHLRDRPDAETARLVQLFSSKLGLPPESVLLEASFQRMLERIIGILRPAAVHSVGPWDETALRQIGAAGTRVASVPAYEQAGFRVDAAAMQTVRASKGDLFIVAEPNRVTGQVAGPGLLRELAALAARKGTTALVDVSFGGFAGLAHLPADMIMDGSIAVIGTTARYYGLVGLELAFALVSPRLRERMDRGDDGGVNLLSVVAARAAWKDSTFERASGTYMREERGLLSRMLMRDQSCTVYPSDSGIVLVRVPGSPDAVGRALGRAGYRAGCWTSADSPDATFVRLTVMKHEDNLKVAKLLGGLAAGGGG